MLWSRTKYIFASLITITAVVVFMLVLAHSTLGYDPLGGLTHVFSNDYSVGSSSGVSVPQAAASVKAKVKSAPQVIPPSWPAKLSIPDLNVNAKVQYVGVAADGALAVPTNFTDVAWYREGTVPGDVGTAVIDGHVDNGLGLAGVFKHLPDIQIGDKITVVNNGGKKVTFTVTAIDSYQYTDPAASSAIFGSIPGKKLLRLVTCEGEWVQSAKTYDHRLVITAEAE